MRRITSTRRPSLERLEDRLVPSGAPTLDLTTSGAMGTINGAIFRQSGPQPTGTGVIDSFVRLQAHGAGASQEQGYNTDARPLQLDENKSPQFTRSLQLGAVPTVDIGGVVYREFLLDINQKSSQPYLSLDELRLYVGGAPNLTGYDPAAGTLAGLSPVYNLKAGGDNWVKLDARLSHGSGSGDMFLYVPDALFQSSGSNPYVYLYSKFGVNYTANSGFEEWATGHAALTSATGVISGTVYQNVNGVQVGLADQVIFLDANHNGVLDSDEVFTITDANGNYSFNDLATSLGNYSIYQVTVLPQAGDTLTTSNAVLINLLVNGQDQSGVNFVVSTQPSTPPPGPPPVSS